MSEQQYVAFRAIDKPVSKDNLEYMHTQSSRAEITARAFDNEYSYGDFRGDIEEMMRRGFEFHLHYANFGIRKLCIRFPNGIPTLTDKKLYFVKDGLDYKKDKNGSGGILSIDPCFEPEELENIHSYEEFGDLADRMIPLRNEILSGDLRPLYLARLGVLLDQNHDETDVEAPVPAGLDDLTDAQSALAEFLGVSEDLVMAAALESPPMLKRENTDNPQLNWLKGLPQNVKDQWIAKWMLNPDTDIRGQILDDYRKVQDISVWPTVPGTRTIETLNAVAEEITREVARKASANALKAKAMRLAKMVKDPAKVIAETEKLVALRNSEAYSQAAKLLAELREALSGTKDGNLAIDQVHKLRKDYPKLHGLTAAFKEKKLLPR